MVSNRVIKIIQNKNLRSEFPVMRLRFHIYKDFWVLVPTFRVPGLGFRVPVMRWFLGLGSRIPSKVPVLWSHFWDMPKRNCSDKFDATLK